jgi:hypothetical protein
MFTHTVAIFGSIVGNLRYELVVLICGTESAAAPSITTIISPMDKWRLRLDSVCSKGAKIPFQLLTVGGDGGGGG